MPNAAALALARHRLHNATYRLQRAKLRRIPGLELDRAAYVHPSARIISKGTTDRIRLEAGSVLRHGVYLETFGSYAILEAGASIGPYCVLYAQGGLRIGPRVSIGPHCVISTGGHRFNEPGSIRNQGFTASPIDIGADVWIGANVTIIEGLVIAPHAVVAAGAVVTSDVPRGAIVAGVPAHVHRFRTGYGDAEPKGR